MHDTADIAKSSNMPIILAVSYEDGGAQLPGPWKRKRRFVKHFGYWDNRHEKWVGVSVPEIFDLVGDPEFWHQGIPDPDDDKPHINLVNECREKCSEKIPVSNVIHLVPGRKKKEIPAAKIRDAKSMFNSGVKKAEIARKLKLTPYMVNRALEYEAA